MVGGLAMSAALRHAEAAQIILTDLDINVSSLHSSEKIEIAKAEALASIALSLASIDGALTNTAGPSGRIMIEVAS